MLGDGHIRNPNKGRRPGGNSRLEFTFKASVYDFICWLKFEILGNISTSAVPIPYPKENPKHYWFATRNSIEFTEIEKMRYTEDLITKKRVKILPKKKIFDQYFTEVSLAH